MLKYETVDVTVDDGAIAEGNAWTAIEPVWRLANIYDGPDEYERSLQPFSNQQRLMFALQWYISEVCNGGHGQFYSNSTGIVWKDACNAFAAMNVKEGADILLESAERLGGEPSLDRDERNAALDRYAPDFDDLDDRLYELLEKVDIDQAMLAFIRANSAAFHFSGQITRVVFPDFKSG